MSWLTTGWFRRPLSTWIRVRRSTVILVAVFVALLLLYLAVRPRSSDDEQPSPTPFVVTTVVTEVPTTVGS